MNICMLSDKFKNEKRMPLIPDDIIELKNTSAKFKDRKSTRLNSSHSQQSRMPSSA